MRKSAQGQNLVELVLTLPFLLILVFAVIEMGRVWQVYESAKTAAMDGAYVASVYQDPIMGQQQIQTRLNTANIAYTNVSVQPVNSAQGAIIGYQSNVTVIFIPLMGGISLPTLSGPISIIPNQIPITYRNISYNSVY